AITSLAAPTITANSITIVWERDTNDEDIDHYNVYNNDDLISDDVSSKTYTDTGLEASVEYIYKVSAVDFAGNEGPKTSQRATTRSEDYQQISVSGFQAETIGTNIHVTWQTNIPGHSRVVYSQNPLVLDQKNEQPELTTSHNITLTGLPSNTNITLAAQSCTQDDACGNSSPLTVSTTETIALNLEADGFDCDSTTATFHNSNRLDVQGTASPGADIT
ncbi:fibronectin type III domain-containing protein, partial [Candidatus Woesearchaeota archaeon]|nr:fibronectin type III domain-containing protein [Candidatus Woesearchaeota archaeon]